MTEIAVRPEPYVSEGTSPPPDEEPFRPGFTGLRCRACGDPAPEGPVFVCTRCFGPLEAVYDLDGLSERLTRETLDAREATIWRYAELLPVSTLPRAGLRVGLSPLVPLAAGENHYTRWDFARLLEDKAVTIWQPDLSKTGGITEALRIAAMSSAFGIALNPHCSATGINHAATLHFLAALDNGGYFEACVSKFNPLRDMFGRSFTIGADGCVEPPDAPVREVEAQALREARLKLQPNDPVRVPKFDKTGRVVRVDHRRNLAVVSVGIGQWEVSLDEVFPLPK